MSYKLAGVIWNNDGTMKTKKPSPLKSLERIRKNLTRYSDIDDEPYLFKQDEIDLDMIEKSLKALEIIKNKRLYWDINYQPYEECGHYRAWDNELYESVELTKEEYDLLKEVLK